MAKLKLPVSLHKYCGNLAELDIPVGNGKALTLFLKKDYAELARALLNDDGTWKRFVKIYVDQKMQEAQSLEKIEFQSETEIQIVMALAGG